MKKTIHKADSRGYADHGWLKSYHTFSFANYYNPERSKFGVLRVLNDDVIEAGMGFGTHPHDNMEIITIPIKGEVAHKDSTGTKGVIKDNEVQIMSAGSGLTHSEFNNSESDPLSLLQIWLFPKEKNIKPRYDQRSFSAEEMKNSFKTVVSPDEADKALWINQDSVFALTNIEKGKSVKYDIKFKGNGMYLFVIEGSVKIDGDVLSARDAMGIEDADGIEVTAEENSKVLLIELPMN
ncbi:MAG: pirin family protein [bacterium]|nr:pirin family protein [bacterium]